MFTRELIISLAVILVASGADCALPGAAVGHGPSGRTHSARSAARFHACGVEPCFPLASGCAALQRRPHAVPSEDGGHGLMRIRGGGSLERVSKLEKAVVIANVTVSIAVGGIKAISRAFRRGRRNGERDAGDGAKRKLTEGERVRLKKEEKARKDSEGIMFSAGKGSKVREEMIRARMLEQEVVSTSPMRARAAEKQRKEKVEAAKREKKQKEERQRKKQRGESGKSTDTGKEVAEEDDDDLVGSVLSLALKRPIVTLMAIDSLLSIFSAKGVPSQCVLELDLGAIRILPADPEPSNYFEALQSLEEHDMSVRVLVAALAQAKKDDRVKGLIVHLPSSKGWSLDIGLMQEVSDAILSFRSSGKVTVAWSDSFDSNSEYALACACQYIFVQPSGQVWLTGLNFEVQFIGSLLKRWGIRAQLSGREEYKSAKNFYTERRMSEAQRRNMLSIAGSIFEQLTDSISRSRNISVPVLRQIIDRAPLTAEEAVGCHLTDAALYREGVYAAVRDLVSSKKRGAVCPSIHPEARSGGAISVLPRGRRGGGRQLDVGMGRVMWGSGRWLSGGGSRSLSGAKVSAFDVDWRCGLKIEWNGGEEDERIEVSFKKGKEERDEWLKYLEECIKHVDDAESNTSFKTLNEVPTKWAVAGRNKDPTPKKKPSFLYVHKYGERFQHFLSPRRLLGLIKRRPKVAIVMVRGEIKSGSSGKGSAGADTVCRAIRAATRDKQVKAIVLRVDSPGGSAVASDTIWREVCLARIKGTPVIASMGGMAASGGYYVSAPATKIIAEPGTLTGSIGVVGGKVTGGSFLARELGVTFDSVTIGKRAALMSGVTPFNRDGQRWFESSLDLCYADFITCVAMGRGLSVISARAASLPVNCTEAKNLMRRVDTIRSERESLSKEEKRGPLAKILGMIGFGGNNRKQGCSSGDGVVGWQLMDRGAGGFNVTYIEMDSVRRVAKGRVWTGKEALAVGLVDDIGGILAAVDAAKEAANIKKGRKVQVRVYPKHRSFLAMLLDSESGAENSDSEGGISAHAPRLAGGLIVAALRNLLSTAVSMAVNGVLAASAANLPPCATESLGMMLQAADDVAGGDRRLMVNGALARGMQPR